MLTMDVLKLIFTSVIILAGGSLSGEKILADLHWEAKENDCPGLGDRMLPVINIPWGVPGRAYLTVPPEVEIAPSTIPGAGLGAIATTFIPKYTWLGEYQGFTVPTSNKKPKAYAWMTTRGGEDLRNVEAVDVETSNWVRFVNAPRNVFEENVVTRQCRDKMFYQTMRDIAPGEELLVSYGEGYAKALGVWPEYVYSQILSDIGREVNTKRNLREVFNKFKKILKKILIERKRRKASLDLITVFSENNRTFRQLLGQDILNILSTRRYAPL